MMHRLWLSTDKEIVICLQRCSKKVVVIFNKHLSDSTTQLITLDVLSWNSLRSLVHNVNKYFSSNVYEPFQQLVNPMRNLYVRGTFYANTKLIDIRIDRNGHFTKEGISLSKSSWEKFTTNLEAIDEFIFCLHMTKSVLVKVEKLLAKELMKSTISFCDGCRENQPGQLAHDCLLDEWFGEPGRFASIKQSIVKDNVDSLNRSKVISEISKLNDTCFPPDKLLNYVLDSDLLELCEDELLANPKEDVYEASCFYNYDTDK